MPQLSDRHREPDDSGLARVVRRAPGPGTVPAAIGEGRVARIPGTLRRRLEYCARFPERVLFLDVETTGLSHYYDRITVLGWSFGGRACTCVRGNDAAQFREDAAQAAAVVTFNGIRFDAKFIAREFPDVELPDTHIDLVYLCRRAGLTGGQKAIEKALGLKFRGDAADIDGAAAVLLWHRYIRGDTGALRDLIRYNRADIAAMGAIFDCTAARLGFEPNVAFADWSAPPGWRAAPAISPPKASLTEQRLRLSDVSAALPFARPRVVGIDLTGSEKRGSGWCLLHGIEARTAVIFTDEDIVRKTISAEPALVSIDSPLCLPTGRTSVGDDDPGRERYGIMRESERELKRRGINVYPCLIPSMQRLTARGMALADRFRRRGVPTIESYPGAAQDIMHIPRKGAGVKWLEAGLQEFGVTGGYDSRSTTHDELDAITSAIVGMFHLAGMSEALGADSDDASLIVPLPVGRPGPFAVGVSGPIAAGKTTLARALERKGFAYTRFSLAIDDMLAARKQRLTRANRQELGREINASGAQRRLCARALARVPRAAARIVIDGLRFPDDHAYMAERFGARFLHVHIGADSETRRRRYERGAADIGFDEAAGASVESRVGELGTLAHREFDNGGAIRELERYAGAIGSETQRCPYPS